MRMKCKSIMVVMLATLSTAFGDDLRARIGQQTQAQPCSFGSSGRKTSEPVNQQCIADKPYVSSDFTSFFDVEFGSTIDPRRFIRFNGAKDVWSYKLDSKFRSYEYGVVRTNPRTEKIYWVGILSKLEGDQAGDEAEFNAMRRWILGRFGHLNFKEVTISSDPETWDRLARAGCPEGVLQKCCSFFLVPNKSGEWSNVITLCIWVDREKHEFYIRLNAEDLVVEFETVEQNNAMPVDKPDGLNSAREALARRREDARHQREVFNARPELESFCGITFGSVLKGDLQRTGDGRYLTGHVKLITPFRGVKYACVYAGVKSRKIFSIVLETNDNWGTIAEILDRKYNPSKNELISKCSGGPYRLKNSVVSISTKEIGTGETYYQKTAANGTNAIWEGEPVWLVEKEKTRSIAVMNALHETFKKLADREYDDESGGDGSSVL